MRGQKIEFDGPKLHLTSHPASSLQDSDEAENDEEMALQSGSEGTSSEPREDHTDASSVEASGSSRPRRTVTLRRAVSAGSSPVNQEAPGGRRRSTRSLSAYNQNNNKYQPPKEEDMQVSLGIRDQLTSMNIKNFKKR